MIFLCWFSSGKIIAIVGIRNVSTEDNVVFTSLEMAPVLGSRKKNYYQLGPSQVNDSLRISFLTHPQILKEPPRQLYNSRPSLHHISPMHSRLILALFVYEHFIEFSENCTFQPFMLKLKQALRNYIEKRASEMFSSWVKEMPFRWDKKLQKCSPHCSVGCFSSTDRTDINLCSS